MLPFRPTRNRALSAGIFAMAMTLAVSACGSDSSEGPAAAPSSQVSGSAAAGDIKVAFIETNEEAGYFQDMKKGVTEAATAAGVSLDVYNANSDPAKQVQAIQTYVSQGYQALVVSPIDENGLVSALQAAHDQGVKTIVIDSGMTGPGIDLSVGTDNAAAAVVAGEWLIDWQKSQPDMQSLQVGIIGALTSVPQNTRKDSFVSTIEATGATILQTVNGNNVQATAQSAAQALFTAQPSMNLLYATGEPALIGAVAGQRAEGSKVKIFGWDMSPSAIQGLDDGSVIGVVQQTPGIQGKIAIDSAVTLLGGGTVEPHISTSVKVVTKADVDEYRDLYGS